MHDPVFGVSAPRAKLRRYRLLPNMDVRRVAVLSDVYDVPEVHRVIASLSEEYVRNAEADMICLEGTEGPIGWPAESAILADLEAQYPGLSTATRNVLLMRTAEVRVVGVEEPGLQASARRAMASLEPLRRRVSRVRRRLRKLLLHAQRRHYFPELSELRRCTVDFYGEEASLGRRVRLCQALLRKADVSPGNFPQIAAMAAALSTENDLDFARIEAARSKVVESMVHGIQETFRAANGRAGACRALRRFGYRTLGIEQAERQRSVGLRGERRFDHELQRLITFWFIKEAIRLRKGERTQGAFYGEMVELAETLGVTPESLGAVRAYADYVQLSESGIVPEALMRQEREIPRFIVRRLMNPSMTALFQLEERLDELHKGVRLQLTPDIAEALRFEGDEMRECLTQVLSLAKPSWVQGWGPGRWLGRSLRMSAEAVFEEALPNAKAFYHACLDRSRSMAEKSLRAMDDGGSRRAIIIAGGFHTDAIARVLDDRGDIAWSFVTPEFELPPAGRRFPEGTEDQRTYYL